MASQPVSQQLTMVVVQRRSLVEAMEEMARGKDRDYLSSIRCPNCCGWPVMVGHQYEEAVCSYCDEVVEEQIVAKYFKVKGEVKVLLSNEKIKKGIAYQCMNMMSGLFHAYDLTYIAACEVALTDCVIENKAMKGLNIAQIMFEVSRRMARGSSAQVELALRMMRLQAELGLHQNLDTLVKIILSDAYSDDELCSQILQLKKILYRKINTRHKFAN